MEQRGENSNEDQNITILDLNDDCYFMILKKMDLKSQISFASSHEQFKNVFQSYAKLNYRLTKSHWFNDLTLCNKLSFFMFAGHCIETYTGNIDGHQEIINSIKKYCFNLLELQLYIPDLELSFLRDLLSNKPKLKTLHLYRCRSTDQSFDAIKNLCRLENLMIKDCEHFTGIFLYTIKGLKQLTVQNFDKLLQISYLQRALVANPNLEYLDIRSPLQFTNEFFRNLPSFAKNVETLKISLERCSNKTTYENVAKMPKLKNLSISLALRTNSLRIELLSQLVKEKCDQLESLKIFQNLKSCTHLSQIKLIAKIKSLKRLQLHLFADLNDECLGVLSELSNLEKLELVTCRQITNDGVLNIVCQCQKLKYLNIKFTNIDNEFAINLIKHLKENQRKNGRITIYAAGSEINVETLPMDYKDEEARAMVKFEFDYI